MVKNKVKNTKSNGKTKKKKPIKTKKRKVKKTIMKGGFFRKINKKYIREWNSIHREPMDCCPCVFNLLELDLYESLSMIDKYGITGMENNEIIEVLKNKYPEYSFSLKNTYTTLKDKMLKMLKLKKEKDIVVRDTNYKKYYKEYSEEVSNFFSIIPENHGVIGIIRGPDFNHCVVFAKMKGKLVYYDAQLKKSIIGISKIGKYLIEKMIYQIDYVQGIETAEKSQLGPWSDIYSSGNWGINPNDIRTDTLRYEHSRPFATNSIFSYPS